MHLYADTILAMAEQTGEPLHKGLGLRMKAQAYSRGKGDHRAALPYFDQTIDEYRKIGDVVREARTHITRLWALFNLGLEEEALETGKWSERVLEQNEQWRSLGILRNNLGMLFRRKGDPRKALEMFDKARETLLDLGEDGRIRLANVELNRSVSLHFLGKHREAIKVGETAIVLSEELNQDTTSARAKHIIGMAYRALGDHTRALHFLTLASRTYLANSQHHQAALSDLASAEVLVEIRQFERAIENCINARKVFRSLDINLHIAGTLHLEGVAHQGLGNHISAQESFEESLLIYTQIENRYYAAITELALARLELINNQPIQSRDRAKSSLETFKSIDMPVEASYSQLAEARANHALGQTEDAMQSVEIALSSSIDLEMPHLAYQCHAAQGEIEEGLQNFEEARTHYTKSIDAVEAWRGNVMSEFQGTFTEDKEAIYEKLVSLLLREGDTLNAFAYVDRAKSASLQGLLSGQSDLKIKSLSVTDDFAVREINALIERRREVVFQQKQSQETGENPDWVNLTKQISHLEDEITKRWHELLIGNQVYAQQLTPWEPHTDIQLPYLDHGTVLIQYFKIQEEYIALIAKKERGSEIKVRSFTLSSRPSDVIEALQSLHLNMEAAATGNADIIDKLVENAKALLTRLHDYLIAQIEDAIDNNDHLIIVPYKELHYVPFQALFDGSSFLVERYEVSYLPNASTWKNLTDTVKPDGQPLVVGHSQSGHLPYTLVEASELTTLLGAKLLLEEEATIGEFIKYAKDSSVIHFAGHGEFREDNPLFSGLVFEDGLLSMLDIFNLELNAKLVTLSACEGGRIEVGGGDELYGLIRAFFSCGVESLLFSQWQVDDGSTRELMAIYYTELSKGKKMSTALRAAQRKMLENAAHRHPYYWAPFYLIGNSSARINRKMKEVNVYGG